MTLTYDERTAARPDPENRRHYRYQIQGPNAAGVIADATGAPAPDLKFFHMCEMTIGGKQVTALRHGMAGQPGYELMGPWADRDAVHAGAGRGRQGARYGAGRWPHLFVEHAGIRLDPVATACGVHR